jgi:hypothetical protein
MKFTKPLDINTVDASTLQPGQWVTADGAKGRFAGVTPSGTVVVAWNAGLSFKAYRTFCRRRAITDIRKHELATYRAFA